MAGLIKNQILKHLTKFSKNLSPDKINVSTLKGEGDLSDLELDETVLTDLLDLPTWLRLTKATCNRLTIKIQWTKLSSQPICLYLDEIIVEMDTCDTPRTPTSTTPVSSYSTGGKYGFAEQIIDGMCVSINSVIINFRAKDFTASIQLSRILVQSKTPVWQSGSLKMTRLKDELRGEVMIFKEAEWQTLRIEANALDTGSPGLNTTPLRLIANQSKIRVTIKKKIADCAIIASRLQVNLDDLLWVLTDSQLKAALTFAASLRDIVSRSREQSKRLAAEKLLKQSELLSPTRGSQQPIGSQPTAAQLAAHGSPTAGSGPAKVGSQSQQKKAELFSRFDIKETSFHVYTGRVDLHLCDDAVPDGEVQKKVVGGAIQLVLQRMAFDSYPYHRAGADRSHWLRRDENMASRDEWAKLLLDDFKTEILAAHDVLASNNNSPCHPANNVTSSPATNRPLSTAGTQPPPPGSAPEPSAKSRPQSMASSATKPSAPSPSRLLESCVVLRLEDFALYRVSSAMDDRRSTPRRFLSSDKKLLMLPKNMSSVHAEFTEYYFPDGRDFPAPHSNLYIVVNPVCLTVDYLTVMWLNAFLLDLVKNLQVDIPAKSSSPIHVDIRLDTLMPRAILPPTDSLDIDIGRQYGGLEGLQVQLSKAVLTNSHVGESGKKSRNELNTVLKTIDSGGRDMGKPSAEFPTVCSSGAHVPELLRHHADGTDADVAGRSSKLLNGGEEGIGHAGLRAKTFQRMATSDVWFIDVDQLWLEFVMTYGGPTDRTTRRRTVPFVDAFPLVAWLSFSLPPQVDNNIFSKSVADEIPRFGSTKSSHASPPPPIITAVARAGSSRGVKAQLDHKRFCFVMSLVDTLIQVKEEVDLDLEAAGLGESTLTAAVTAVLGNAWVDLILLPVDDYPILPVSPDDDEEMDENEVEGDGVAETVVANGRLSSGDDSLPVPGCDGVAAQAYDSALGRSLASGLSEDIDVTNVSGATIDPRFIPAPVVFSIAETDSQSSTADIISTFPDAAVADPASAVPFSIADNLVVKDHFTAESAVKTSTGSLGTTSAAGSRPPTTLPRVQSDNYEAQRRFSAAGSTGPSDFKKSFNQVTQVFGKITDRIKPGVRRQDTGRFLGDGGELDGWDTWSMHSGASDDEETASLLYNLDAQFEQPAFDRDGATAASDDASVCASDTRDDDVDIGSEVKSQMSAFSGVSVNSSQSQLVSVVTAYLQLVQAVVRLDRDDVTVDASVDNIALKEHGNMTGDKFQEFFVSGVRELPAASETRRPQPLARVHVDVRPQQSSSRHSAPNAAPPTLVGRGAGTGVPAVSRHLTVAVDGFTSQLHMTSLAHIGELFTPSKPGESPIPLRIDASDVFLTLIDDQKSPYGTPPPMTHTEIRVKHATVQKDEHGVIHIGAGATIPSPSTTLLSLPYDLVSGSYRSDMLYDHIAVATQPSLDLPARRRSDGASSISSLQGDAASHVSDLEHENDVLRRQLEKIGKMDGFAIERSSRRNSLEPAAKQPEPTKRDRSWGRREELEKARTENRELVLRLREQADELMELKQERESLLLTIQLLQDDLSSSERQRNRLPSPTQ